MKSIVVRCFIALFIFVVIDICAGENISVIESPYDLQDELILVQLVAPPVETNALEYDSGVFLYLPDVINDFETALFSEGLIFESDEFGNLVAPVSIFEDLESRDTVYLNSENEIIFRIPPIYGYNPFWVFQALYPDVTSPGDLLYQYDPSRVIMKAILLPFKQNQDSEGTIQSLTSPGVKISRKSVDDMLFSAGADGNDTQNDSSVISERVANSTATNRATVVIRRNKTNRNIYVDDINGSDTWNGNAKVRNADKGPKRSIKEGLKAVKSNGRVYIARGCYADKINVRGKKVNVRIEGKVLLSKKPMHKTEPPGATVPLEPMVQTNLVLTVLNP